MTLMCIEILIINGSLYVDEIILNIGSLVEGDINPFLWFTSILADISQYLILSISLVLFATMDRSHSVTQFSILDSLLDIGTNLNPIDSLLTIAQSLYLAHLTDMILSCGVDRFLVVIKSISLTRLRPLRMSEPSDSHKCPGTLWGHDSLFVIVTIP